jgi:RNA polymerase sigma-70 factor (ECF subfamily)
MSDEIQPDLEQYRSYLKLLAGMDLGPRLRAREDVSDVAQRTLLKAHQGFAAFRGTTEAELRAWLKTILTNQLKNLAKYHNAEKRDGRREVSLDQMLQGSATRIMGQLSADQTSPSQNAIRRERAEQLADAMAGLLEDESSALVLMYVHNCKVDEIAKHLSRTPVAVAGLLRRGKKKLRKSMAESSSDV